MSRERLAARSGLSARTIYNLEHARGTPRAITLIALARALGCKVEDLLPDELRAEQASAGHNEKRPDGGQVALTTASAGQGRHGPE